MDLVVTNVPGTGAGGATTARPLPLPVPELPVDLWSEGMAAPPPTPRPPPARRPSRRDRSRRRMVTEWVAVLVVAVVLAVGVRTFVAQMFYIPSGSMLPTLQIGERIVVDKVGYHLDGIRRGDIVVFRRPPGEPVAYADLVKRVIGLPGETIGTSDGRVTVDGRPLAEPWLPVPPPPTLPSPVSAPYSLERAFRVPAGEYFVMGDNRTDSEDSRYFGPIPGSLIVGRMAFKVWPLGAAVWLSAIGVVVVGLAVLALVGLRGARRSGRHTMAKGRAPPGARGSA